MTIHNEKYLDAVKHVHYWQYGQNPTNFTSLLFRLFQKADACNKARLGRAFPIEMCAYMEWYECESQDKFFERYGLPPFYKYIQGLKS